MLLHPNLVYNNYLTSPKAYWAILKMFLNNKKIPCIPPIYHNKNYITEKTDIINIFFAKQFIIVSNTRKIPTDSLKRTKNFWHMANQFLPINQALDQKTTSINCYVLRTIFINLSMKASRQGLSFLTYEKNLIKIGMRVYFVNWSKMVYQVLFWILSRYHRYLKPKKAKICFERVTLNMG